MKKHAECCVEAEERIIFPDSCVRTTASNLSSKKRTNQTGFFGRWTAAVTAAAAGTQSQSLTNNLSHPPYDDTLIPCEKPKPRTQEAQGMIIEGEDFSGERDTHLPPDH
ncbi:unnamed protein product [Allacma fusca]|uniref:Uncharacterized protein n=1 Tax=Allacma fusca TaxID=39272 RepID=A0A8J2KCV9_9HEXA|nr:unnamed protein product [Allacma fusca]